MKKIIVILFIIASVLIGLKGINIVSDFEIMTEKRYAVINSI